MLSQREDVIARRLSFIPEGNGGFRVNYLQNGGEIKQQILSIAFGAYWMKLSADSKPTDRYLCG
jgi:hypothetical protein